MTLTSANNAGFEKNLRHTANLTVLRFFFYIAMFTISFDIFLVIEMGFNFRFAQLALLIPIAALPVQILLKKKYMFPIGFASLTVWAFFVLIFVPNSNFPLRSIGYAVWLIFNICMIMSCQLIFKDPNTLYKLIRYYIYSFAFVALFGLIQFLLPLMGIDPPLVTQWWFPGKLARINGFSYEPSYFSTYILTGWIFTAWLLKKGTSLISRRSLNIIFALETIVMILSTSRMAWIMMILWYLHYPVQFTARIFYGKLNMPALRATVILSIIALISTVAVISVIGAENMRFLIAGLGIAGESAHSSGTRTNEFLDTIQLFLDSPFAGYSLGGISSALGELRSVDVSSIEAAKENEGMNVFAEVLAASGVFGFIPFMLYIGTLIIKPIRIASKICNNEISTLLIGMVVSLGFLLLILQMNQNILRPYLWLHIAILSTLYSVARKTRRIEIADGIYRQ